MMVVFTLLGGGVAEEPNPLGPSEELQAVELRGIRGEFLAMAQKTVDDQY
jgi:hypothetical protein